MELIDNEEPCKICHQSAALNTLFITTFDNEVGVLSYPYALTEVGEYDNWSMQKLKVKEEQRIHTAN